MIKTGGPTRRRGLRCVDEALFEKHLFRFDRSKKLGQFRRSHRELLGMTLPDSSEFLAGEPDLLLGPAAKYRVVLRVAFGPLALHESWAVPASKGS